MALEDTKEKLRESLHNTLLKIQESPSYGQLKEKYEGLSPRAQKGVWIVLILIVGLILLSFPLSYFSTSKDNMAEFEELRQTTRHLLRVEREASQIQNFESSVTPDSLQSRLDGALAMINLVPEQRTGSQPFVTPPNERKLIPAGVQQTGLTYKFQNLNVTQLAEIGRQIENIDSQVRIWSLKLQPAQDPKYLNAEFNVMLLSLPSGNLETENQALGRGN